jgi:four helix bundle protein
MAEELKILQKIFDMMTYGYQALAQFPKSEKFALVTDIKHCMDVILERCIEAQKKYYKKTTLQDMDVELMKLRAYLRLSFNLGFLPIKKYEVWSEMVVELGKMLGGWLKSVKGQPHGTGSKP